MGLFPAHIEAALVGVPRGPESKVFLVSAVHGNDGNDGLSWKRPLKTVEAAYALCTTLHNDVVLVLGEGTSFQPTAALTWAKDFCHLIGLNSGGAEPRSRIKSAAALATTPFVTWSGDGCLVRNISFWHETSNAAGLVNVYVTGGRNTFDGCQFAGAVGTNNASGARSLKLGTADCSGNTFRNCWIGTDTIQEAAGVVDLEIGASTMHTLFDSCIFAHSAGATAQPHVTVNAAPGRLNLFRKCLFINEVPSVVQAEVFKTNGALAESSVIFVDECWKYGATDWNHDNQGVITNVTIAANTTGVNSGNTMIVTSS